MRKILLVLIFLGCALCQTAQAQERRVTGTVKDASTGVGLPGVTVLVKGTTTGTVTDMNGSYSLSVDPATATLVFSFIGYVDQTIPVNNRSVIDVRLAENVEQLSEVVVVGYGVQEKKDATGAVQSVKAEDFNTGMIASPEQLIQGKSAGVQITQASGEPGAGINIRVRGTASVRANNNPLFVVDGVPLSGDNVSAGGIDVGRGTSSARNPLNFLNPNDIASIDILKDASATAIYGARGANGVILITTKSGRGKKQVVEYSTAFSVSEVANKLDLLDRDQFLSNAARIGADVEALDFGANTDWQDEILRTSLSQKHDLSYANSYNTGNYRVSLSYDDQEGIVRTTGLERYSARANWNQSFMDEKLNFALNGTVSRINDQQAFISDNVGFEGDLIATMYIANPTWPAYAASQIDNTVANPLAWLAYYQDNTRTNRYLINASLDYDITPDLNFRVNGGLDNASSMRGYAFSPRLRQNFAVGNGRAVVSELESGTKILEALFNYDKRIGEGKLTALLGYSYQKFEREGNDVQGFGFRGVNDMNAILGTLRASRDVLRNELGARGIDYQGFGLDPTDFFFTSIVPEAQIQVLSDVSTDVMSAVDVNSIAYNTYAFYDELQSYFGRVNYSLRDKYLFTATLRADGSTKFGADNAYGYFPSAAFAWRLSEEDFTPDVFQDLKLRIGYGVTGNQEIDHNLHQSRIRYNGPGIDEGGNVNTPGLSSPATPNPGLQWEETTQTNLGVDFEVLRGKLSGSIDLYRKVTTDLLIRVDAVQPSPGTFQYINLDADVVNRGIEVALNWYAIGTDNFGLTLGINGAYNENEVQDFGSQLINTGGINGQGLTGAYAQVIVEGQPLYAYFLRDFLGFDRNGIAIYNEDAQELLGKSPLPKYNAGFNLNARYKNWDLAAYLNGQFGHYIYNNTANAFFTLGSLANGRNITTDALFTGEAVANAPDASSRFLEKGDYVRFQNLNLGYTTNFGSEGLIKALRVSLGAQNLFVITDYSGVDPEVNVNKSLSGVPSAGIDYTAYPRARTYTLGLNVTF